MDWIEWFCKLKVNGGFLIEVDREFIVKENLYGLQIEEMVDLDKSLDDILDLTDDGYGLCVY
jgi:hypothetical protein